MNPYILSQRAAFVLYSPHQAERKPYRCCASVMKFNVIRQAQYQHCMLWLEVPRHCYDTASIHQVEFYMQLDVLTQFKTSSKFGLKPIKNQCVSIQVLRLMADSVTPSSSN